MLSNLALFYLSVAIIFSVIGKLMLKHVMNKIDAYANAMINVTISALMIIPLLFIFEVRIPDVNSAGWIILGFACIVWSAALIIGNISFKKAEVSVREPVIQTRIIWILLFGIIFIGETLTINKIIGTTLVFVGATLVAIRKQKIKGDWKQEIGWSLLSAFAGAVAFSLDKVALSYFSPNFLAFSTSIIPGLILLIFMKGRMEGIKYALKNIPIAAIGGAILWTITYYFTILTFSEIDLTVAWPIMQLTIILTVISGIIIFKETGRIWQKLLASLIVIAGVIIIGR